MKGVGVRKKVIPEVTYNERKDPIHSKAEIAIFIQFFCLSLEEGEVVALLMPLHIRDVDTLINQEYITPYSFPF